MLYLSCDTLDPYFHLALEELLLAAETKEEILLLWRSRSAVICGRYQNIYAEADVLAAKAAGVDVARRLTGGGTVYHDEGNLNYTILTDYDGSGSQYDRFLMPVVRTLRQLGVPAETGRICDITADGKKISGSAQKVSGSRILHHGTLLFHADLTALRRIANGAREEYRSKGVASSPWPVTNLCDYLPGMTMEDFRRAMLTGLTAGKDVTARSLTAEEHQAAQALANTKYRTWDWIYGKNPEYTLTRGDMTLTAKHGVITELNTAPGLIGCRLDPDAPIDAKYF